MTGVFRSRAGWWAGWLIVLLAGAATGAAAGSQSKQLVPTDLIRFSRAGLLIVTGHWSRVYDSAWTQGGPFELVASFLLLPTDHQRATGFVQDWESLYWQRLALGALLAGAVPFAVRRLRHATGLPEGPGQELLAGGVFVLLQGPGMFWGGGHLAQLVVPCGWIWAAVLARRGGIGTGLLAGVLIGLSAGWEPWGVLGLPLLMLDRERRRVAGAALVAIATAAAGYLPFALAGPFRMFELRWPVAPVTLVHVIWPGATTFDWTMRLGQAGVAVLFGALVVLVLGRHPDVVWVAPLAVTLGRLLLDPLNLSYYWAPVVISVCIGFGLLTRAAWPVGALSLAVLGLFARGPGWAEVLAGAPRVTGVLTVGLPAVLLLAMSCAGTLGRAPCADVPADAQDDNAQDDDARDDDTRDDNTGRRRARR